MTVVPVVKSIAPPALSVFICSLMVSDSFLLHVPIQPLPSYLFPDYPSSDFLRMCLRFSSNGRNVPHICVFIGAIVYLEVYLPTFSIPVTQNIYLSRRRTRSFPSLLS